MKTKKTIKTTVEVEISNLEVNEFYFYFSYILWINSKKIDTGNYESDHSWGSSKEEMKKFMNILKSGYAVQLILEQTEIDV